MKKKIVIPILLIAAALAAGLWYFLPETPSEPYTQFVSELEAGHIEKVSIGEDNLKVTLKDGSSFKTTNPASPDMKEKLLLQGIDVKMENSGEETVSLILDILFYVIFFGAIAFAIKRFIVPNRFKITRKTGVTFDDICGMDDLKKNMKIIADIMKNPALAKKQGIRCPKGILLTGAPGNGKTMFARALAQEAGVNFIATRATDFESFLIAVGPMKVKMLFAKARKAKPCIIFIDEFDGIGTVRNYSGNAIETENTRIVTALLNELDGFVQNDGILVMAATNSIEALDPALIRPGRFDGKYTIPNPDAKTRRLLIEKYTKGKNFKESLDVEKLVKQFEGASCAEIESSLNNMVLYPAE